MSSRIYVVKYVKDPRRWEPRNVGLIAISDEAQASKFLGEQPDGNIHRNATVRSIVNDTDIYVDWVSYFRRTLTPGDEGISEIVQNADSSYLVMEAGEVWQGSQSPADLVAEYFPKLVKTGNEPDEDATDLEPVVENLLLRVGAPQSGHLERDYAVPSNVTGVGGKPILYKFHYFWENGHKMVAHRLALKRPEWARGQLFQFEHIDPEITKVAFITSRSMKFDLEAEIVASGVDETIDVDSKTAMRNLERLFNA